MQCEDNRDWWPERMPIYEVTDQQVPVIVKIVEDY